MRYNRFIYVLSCLLAVAACAPSDENSPAPEDVFVKYYGDQSAHKLYDVAVNGSGEFILFGTRKVDGDPEGSNFYLCRTDAGGNLLEDAVLDVDSTEDIAARIKVIEGGYLIVGHVAELNAALLPQAKKLYWARLNEDFEAQESIVLAANDVYADADSINDEVAGVDILLLQNDSVLVLGYSDVVASNELTKPDNLRRQILVQKASQEGEVKWTKTLGYQNSDEAAVAIFEETDGSIIIIGSASDVTSAEGHGGTNVCFYHFNQQLTAELNAPRFGITVGTEQNYDEVPYGVYRSSPNAGSFVITGTSTFGAASRPFVMTITATGSLINAGRMVPNDTTGNSAFGYGVTRTLTNDYVVVGTIENWSSGAGDGAIAKEDEIMFIRTDQFLNTIPEYGRNFGTTSGNDEAVVAKTLDDGSIVIGGTVDFGSGVSLFTLMKMNDRGELKE